MGRRLYVVGHGGKQMKLIIKYLLPKNLAAQMIILTLMAIFIAQIISFMIFNDERHISLRTESQRQLLSNIASITTILEKTPSNIHKNIINAASIDGLKLSINNKALLKGNKENFIEKGLKRRLLKKLPDIIKKVNVKIHRGHDDWKNKKTWKRFHNNGDEFSNDEYHKIALSQEIIISLHLDNGKWLNINSKITAMPQLWAMPSLMAMLVTAIAIIIIVIIMMRRVTKPMANLAIAAERLGRGDGGTKIKATGPKDIKKTIDAFNLMQTRLDKFIKDRTEMLAAISHDLRTPITSLRIRTEFIDDKILQEKMIATLNDMQKMVEATLSFAKNDAINENSIKTDIYAILESIIDDKFDMGCDAKISGDKDIIITCRPSSLKRAFNNLIDNAINYGGNTRVSVKKSQNNITILIEDDGAGVDDDKLSQIFEPFYRIDQARNTEYGNVGLGLAIARSIINSHGGDIIAKNIKPHGLLIKINLPQ